MCGFLKNLNTLSLGMLSQGGYLPPTTLTTLAPELADLDISTAPEKKAVSYLPTPPLHDEGFRVCG